MSPPTTRNGGSARQPNTPVTTQDPASTTKQVRSDGSPALNSGWRQQETRVRFLAAGDLLVSPRDGRTWMITAVDVREFTVDIRMMLGSVSTTWQADPDEPVTVLVDLDRRDVEQRLETALGAVREVADDLAPADRAQLISAVNRWGAS